MSASRVAFTCPVCQTVIAMRPSEAKRRKLCSRSCRNVARFHSKQQQINRLKRVMFVHGFTESEARAYLRGWKDGRGAAMQAYLHQRRLTGRKVGSREWESWQAKYADGAARQSRGGVPQGT